MKNLVTEKIFEIEEKLILTLVVFMILYIFIYSQSLVIYDFIYTVDFGESLHYSEIYTFKRMSLKSCYQIQIE